MTLMSVGAEAVPCGTSPQTNSGEVDKPVFKVMRRVQVLHGCLYGKEREKLAAVVHDHCYWELKPWSPPPPGPSHVHSEDSPLDESLQYLLDTCEPDEEFLAQAENSHNNFLDDLINSSDVPADLFPLVHSEDHVQPSLVPTKASCCVGLAPGVSSSLFTCAGTTETTLTTCRFSEAAKSNPASTRTASLSESRDCLVQAGDGSLPSIAGCVEQPQETSAFSPSSPWAQTMSTVPPSGPCDLDLKLLQELAAICPEEVLKSSQSEGSSSPADTTDRPVVAEATDSTSLLASSSDVSYEEDGVSEIDGGEWPTHTDRSLVVDRACVSPSLSGPSSVSYSSSVSSSSSSLPLYPSPPPSPIPTVTPSESSTTSLCRKRKTATECATWSKRLRWTPAPTSLLITPLPSPQACSSPWREGDSDADQDSVGHPRRPSQDSVGHPHKTQPSQDSVGHPHKTQPSQDSVGHPHKTQPSQDRKLSPDNGHDVVGKLLGLVEVDKAFKAHPLSPLQASPFGRCG